MLQKETRTRKKRLKRKLDSDLLSVVRSDKRGYCRAFDKAKMDQRDYDSLPKFQSNRKSYSLTNSWDSWSYPILWGLGPKIAMKYQGWDPDDAYSDLCKAIGKGKRADAIRDFINVGTFFDTFELPHPKLPWCDYSRISRSRFDSYGDNTEPLKLTCCSTQNRRNKQPVWLSSGGFIIARRGIAKKNRQGQSLVFSYDEKTRTWFEYRSALPVHPKWAEYSLRPYHDHQYQIGPWVTLTSTVRDCGWDNHPVNRFGNKSRVLDDVLVRDSHWIFKLKPLNRNLREEYEIFRSQPKHLFEESEYQVYDILKHYPLPWGVKDIDYERIFQKLKRYTGPQGLKGILIWSTLLSHSLSWNHNHDKRAFFFEPAEGPIPISTSQSLFYRLPKHDYAVQLTKSSQYNPLNYFQKETNEQV